MRYITIVLVLLALVKWVSTPSLAQEPDTKESFEVRGAQDGSVLSIHCLDSVCGYNFWNLIPLLKGQGAAFRISRKSMKKNQKRALRKATIIELAVTHVSGPLTLVEPPDFNGGFVCQASKPTCSVFQAHAPGLIPLYIEGSPASCNEHDRPWTGNCIYTFRHRDEVSELKELGVLNPEGTFEQVIPDGLRIFYFAPASTYLITAGRSPELWHPCEFDPSACEGDVSDKCFGSDPGGRFGQADIKLSYHFFRPNTAAKPGPFAGYATREAQLQMLALGLVGEAKNAAKEGHYSKALKLLKKAGRVRLTEEGVDLSHKVGAMIKKEREISRQLRRRVRMCKDGRYHPKRLQSDVDFLAKTYLARGKQSKALKVRALAKTCTLRAYSDAKNRRLRRQLPSLVRICRTQKKANIRLGNAIRKAAVRGRPSAIKRHRSALNKSWRKACAARSKALEVYKSYKSERSTTAANAVYEAIRDCRWFAECE